MKLPKNILAACLTATLVFQSLVPSTAALAEELNAVQGIVSYAAGAQGAAEQGADEDAAEAGSSGSGSSASDSSQALGDASEGGDSKNETDSAAAGSGESAANDSSQNEADAAAADEALSEEGQDSEAAPLAEGAQIQTLSVLETALNGHGAVEEKSEGSATKIKFEDPTALKIISNAAPSLYKNASIYKGSSTGDAFDLSPVKDEVYSFQGFGSEDVPFAGTLEMGTSTLLVSRTLYNGLALSDGNRETAFTWKGGGSDPILAKKIVGNEKELKATVTIADSGAASPKEEDAGITGALLGTVQGDLALEASYSFSGKRRGISVSSTTDNAGLLVDTLKSGKLTLKSLSGIDGAKGTPTVTTSAANCAAGGLIGAISENAAVTIAGAIDVSNLTVTATGTNGTAGGFVGRAAKLSLVFNEGASIKPAQKVGDASTIYAGGVFGDVSFAGDIILASSQLNFDGNAIELGAKKRAGGLFGRLDVSNGDVIIQGGTYKSKLSAGSDGNGGDDSRGSYGGIAGNVCSSTNSAIHDLTVKKTEDANAMIEIERASSLCYVGGVVGYLGENGGSATQAVAAVLDGVEVKINGSATAYASNGKFGGAIGVVGTNNVLDLRNFKLSSENEIGKNAAGGSAGIAGSCWEGVIKFSGTTDLSEAKFADGNKAAQLVFQNSNSLIFATGSGSDGGWTFKRSNAASTVDDIFDYGEVIRLGSSGKLSANLITLDADTHVLNLGTKLQKTGDAYVLNSADDFAKLAITWQSSGRFLMAEGATSGNVSALVSSTISVAGDIDLSGTGLTGLTKDPALNWSWSEGSDKWTFTGKLTGSGSINLAVGEPYGMRNDTTLDSNDTSDGNGKIYRHSYLGLFAIVGAGATVENVTIGGTMRFDNKNGVDAGALAATFNGGSALTVSGAKFETQITYDNTASDKTLNVGGILGSDTGAGAITFVASGGKSTKSNGSITSRVQDQSNPRVGGAIGYIKGDVAASVSVSSLTIGGSISIPDYTGQALAGGFIGYIEQGSVEKTVEITGLSFEEFKLETDAKNTSKKYAGGLLGYSWGKTKLTIGGDANNSDNSYALTASNASVTANNAKEFGGLLYAMSGHFVIKNHALDLSGASLSASGATIFGVLLARGAMSDESHAFGIEGTYTGLYLEVKTEWATAYKVPADGEISAGAATSFDEWIADTTKPGSTTSSGEYNAVISLHTKGDKLYMGTGKDSDNSYQNRTDVGKSHPTNKSARYYYNLDRCLDVAAPKDSSGNRSYKDPNTLVSNGSKIWVKSPEALMIWSACRYAPTGIQNYIAPGLGFKSSNELQIGNSTLGSNGSGYTTIDLDGYSYYPVDLGSNTAIKNSTIKFNYTGIKNIQSASHNKSNAEYTQHANMHMALFRASTRQLTVENATLAGSVASVVKDSDPTTSYGSTNSGALICRSIGGSLGKSSTVSLDGVNLDGLVVDGVDADTKYAPLLINTMPSYASLNVKNLSVTEGSYASGTKAATSLFGRLGGENAQLVTASFSDNVCVPGYKGESIFTRATFLESFGYKEGSSGSSASYIFYSNEEATYGSEIDANGSNNEYVGKQLWYYDEGTYQTDAGLVKDGSTTASAATPAFGSYLPYVAVGKSGTAFHEIKVNQRIASIKTGCGTYTDPFVLSGDREINAVADYINNMNSAVDEWEVTITEDQSVACTRRSDSKTDNEVTYKYQQSSGNWVSISNSSDTLSNDTMHMYMQSAYYSIEPKDNGSETVNAIELDTETFKGFGNEANPFRGVIVGNLKNSDESHTQLTITGSGTFMGLVPYSYGSVVKGLNVVYQGGINSLTYSAKSDMGVPRTFFGGVIGCIMGGDNIIDGVQVSSESSSVQRIPSSGSDALLALLSGDSRDSQLIPVGGYVGAICGGGVIFRNMENTSWRSSTANNDDLYNNPYVGRVIDGYAFSEDCEVDNGNDNYKVNRLDTNDTGCISTGQLYPRDGNSENKAVTMTVSDAQGLLVLSAIINCGAAAGPTQSGDSYYGPYSGVAAYKGAKASTGTYLFGNGNYGKVRNATYTAVGKPNVATDDLGIANEDDQQTPGAQESCAPNAVTESTDVNSPYLVTKYANKLTGYICAPNVSGVDLQFANNETYDMRDYGSGFLGLSGRYYSNACNGGEKSQDRDRIMPAVGCINGNGATILVNNDFKQYANDNYRVQAVGGLFGTVVFADLSGSVAENDLVKDLRFGESAEATNGQKSSSVSLTFVDVNGTATSAPSGENYLAGMLAGVTANRDSLSSGVKYSNVRLESCAVESPKIAGGLLGASGWASRSGSTDISGMADYDSGGTGSPAKLVNCSYDDINVCGGSRVGGFVGALGSNSNSGIWVTADDFVVGKSSIIAATANNCVVGGAFGLSWSPIQTSAPMSSDDAQSYKAVKMQAVSLQNNYAIDSSGNGATYRGTGGIVGNTQSSCEIKNVLVEGSSDTDLVQIGGTASSTENSPGFQSAGGVVGQINAAGDTVTNSFDDVTVRNVKLLGKEGTGGLLGTVLNGSKVQYSNITVDGITVGDTYSGGLVGSIKNEGASIEAQNVKVQNSTFPGDACAAIAGDGKGTFGLSNVLVSKNKYQNKSNQGLLLGKTWSVGPENGKDLKGLYVAGLDIVPEDNKPSSDLPDYVAAANTTSLADIHKVSYVALADYNDASTKAEAVGHYAGDGSDLYSDERVESGSMPAVDSSSPYVTTNPVASNLQVKISDDEGSSYSLFGDGAVIGTAATIKEEAGTSKVGRYTYTNIGGIDGDGVYRNTNNYDASKSKSTFNESNTDSSKKIDEGKNFNVLVVPGNDTSTVTDYLNLVTNGGFSDAVRLNSSNSVKVSAKAQMATLKNGSFVVSNDAASLSVVDNETAEMAFRASTSWDNDQGRFTLLTVTFDSGAGHKYKVQVPIVVKRMLEIDFMATYDYGTKYNSSVYSGLTSHVLTSMGDAMTGYLTWTYNESYGDGSVRYGLDTHLAGGGKLTPVAKTIVFGGDGEKGTLPEGTQLTLVDCAHNNKQYTYTVSSSDTTGTATSIPLTKFTDTDGDAYQEQWLSELMGVTATQSKSGGWVKMDNPSANDIAEKAVAKVDGDYYRLAAAQGETAAESERYSLSLAQERTVSENFYVVVRVPANAPKSVNGFTASSATADVNFRINNVRRYDRKQVDYHSNNESTYSAASSYEQSLVDNLRQESGDDSIMAPLTDSAPNEIKMNVTDTVTVGQNEYTDSDSLYYQLDSSLAQYQDSNLINAAGYPSTVSGIVDFYVKVNGNYYSATWNESRNDWDWESKGATETPAVGQKQWAADGKDMSLVLSDASGRAVDLRKIRKVAGGGSFEIQMKATLNMPGPACKETIMASQDNGSTSYTKPTYRAFLSPHADTLSVSSMAADNAGGARYYRQGIGYSTIALTATKKTQLGINVNDLSSADGTIALVGTYDLSKLSGAAEMLGKASKATYALTLQKRGENGSYANVDDIGSYISIKESPDGVTSNQTSNSFVFTDSGLKTRDADSLALKLRFAVKVNTTVTDFANYRLVLSAKLSSGESDIDTPKNVSGAADYDNSDFVTYTYTRVNTKGIEHQ